MKKLEKEIDIKHIKHVYEPNLDLVFFKEDEVEILKLVISKLDNINKNILLLYLENDCNLKETSKYFSCSTKLMSQKIKEIKEKIKNSWPCY